MAIQTLERGLINRFRRDVMDHIVRNSSFEHRADAWWDVDHDLTFEAYTDLTTNEEVISARWKNGGTMLTTRIPHTESFRTPSTEWQETVEEMTAYLLLTRPRNKT